MQLSRLDLGARFWGFADALRLLIYVSYEVLAGRIPFVGTLQLARETAELVGPLALLLSSLGVALFLSLAPSAILLLTGRRSGAWLSFAQSPFRVVLVVPSIYIPPPIAGLFGDLLGISSGAAVFFAVIVAIEILRIWSLARWLRAGRVENQVVREHAA